jgi:MFS family permease
MKFTGVLFGDKLSLLEDLTRAALGVVGRFGVGIAYNVGTQYAAELIPTEVRGQGVGLIHVAGFAATFFSPHILYLVGSSDVAPPVQRTNPCTLTYFHPFSRITLPAL